MVTAIRHRFTKSKTFYGKQNALRKVECFTESTMFACASLLLIFWLNLISTKLLNFLDAIFLCLKAIRHRFTKSKTFYGKKNVLRKEERFTKRRAFYAKEIVVRKSL